jgi:hypothetical protein
MMLGRVAVAQPTFVNVPPVPLAQIGAVPGVRPVAVMVGAENGTLAVAPLFVMSK